MTNTNVRADATNDAGIRRRMRPEKQWLAAQHVQQNRFRGVVSAGIDRDGATGALDTFLRIAAALDMHMMLEEKVHFRALQGLRADGRAEIEELIAEHDVIRRDPAGIRRLLWANDGVKALIEFDDLAARLALHELIEEKLVARVMDRTPERLFPFESSTFKTAREW